MTTRTTPGRTVAIIGGGPAGLAAGRLIKLADPNALVTVYERTDSSSETFGFGVGLTEAKAKEAGHEVRIGRFPFIGNGKAIAMGEPEGMIKTVFDAGTGELLGAHMAGPEVTEMIQGYTIGKTAELIDEDFARTIFPHPTLSEMMHESVLGAYGRAVHF